MSSEIKEKIVQEVSGCKQSLYVITAFCKENGIKFLEENINESVTNKKILVRFRKDDLISGASDLSIYSFCKANNWNMYVRFDLHAKAYIFDQKRYVIGSANLTNKGLNIISNGNYEIASAAILSEEEACKINSLFNTAILMNDNIYEMMIYDLDKANYLVNEGDQWRHDILKLFNDDIQVLFTFDFPAVISPKECEGRCIEFLELPEDWSYEQVKQSFRMSKAFVWLYTLVNNKNDELYFGEAAMSLQNVIVNDPKPYRKDIKVLVQNLLSWIEELEIDDIIIDRPNYSQRIQIKQ